MTNDSSFSYFKRTPWQPEAINLVILLKLSSFYGIKYT
jgi:hypothetical protein